MKKVQFLWVSIVVILMTMGLSSCGPKCKADGECNADCAIGEDPDCPIAPKEAVLSDLPGQGGINRTRLYADTVYFLQGRVYVNAGTELTIDAGTVIKGKPGSGNDAAALIVARGAKIHAVGTAEKPIIFTAEQDDLTDANDIPLTSGALWGGVVICGAAPLNTQPSELIFEGLASTETRAIYGGTNAADNSGEFIYVSIRHNGTEIGAGKEYNGLTLCGVGSGTQIHHVESYFSSDDAFEFFGGTVNTKYMSAVFPEDDAFDYDQGFNGNGQFWFAIQREDKGDRCGEYDGADTPENGTPFALPEIWNATYLGYTSATISRNTVIYRANGGGEHHNSIFLEATKGITIEETYDATDEDSYKRLNNGDLILSDNAFHNVAGGNLNKMLLVAPKGFNGQPDSATRVADANAVLYTYFTSNNNEILPASPLRGISRVAGAKALNPLTTTTISGATPTGTFFENVSYKGAFGTTNWLKGWTFLDKAAYLAD
ncbi:MAG: hypothetical protein K1X92_14685 [Bacteroidia bacterium]|nr:hypothetical protein [Bacteroidia bacterium]